MAGEVVVNDQRVDKPGTAVKIDANIRLKGDGNPYASRGGLKIAGAFAHWPMDLKDRICIDVGASTGGFTDFLLQHGARSVYAVDVGYGQLHWKLQTDQRVINMERTHILKVSPEDLQPAPDFCVMDVSFISVTKILPHLKTLMQKPSELAILVKPQFELSPAEIGKGGIVRDADKREKPWPASFKRRVTTVFKASAPFPVRCRALMVTKSSYSISNSQQVMHETLYSATKP